MNTSPALTTTDTEAHPTSHQLPDPSAAHAWLSPSVVLERARLVRRWRRSCTQGLVGRTASTLPCLGAP